MDFKIDSEYLKGIKKSNDSSVNELLSEIEKLKSAIDLKNKIISDKSKSIEYYRYQFLHNQKRSVINLTLSDHDDKGEFMKWKDIEIPSDDYIQSSPGIWLRSITNKNNVIDDFEKQFLKQFKEIDFKKYQSVIICKAEKNSLFPLHYHIEEETIVCLTGCMHDRSNLFELKSGDSITYKSMQTHEPFFIEDTVVLALVHKPT